MKTTLSILFLAASLLGCEAQLESEIKAMHQESRATGDEVTPLLEQLVQQKASINIQGRALTQEEIAFTQNVENMEATFAQWNKGMEKAEGMKPDKERYSLEQALKDAIFAFKKQVMALAPPTPL